MSSSPAVWAHETLRALSTLTDSAATVLSLHYFEQLDEAQICARTGWSKRRVRRVSSSALGELGRLLVGQASTPREPSGYVAS